MVTIGPVEYLAIEVPASALSSEIVPALQALMDSGTVRLLDFGAVTKDAQGHIATLRSSVPERAATAPGASGASPRRDLLWEEDLQLVGQRIAPNTAAGVILWEHTWATHFVEALRSANGRMVVNQHAPWDILGWYGRLVTPNPFQHSQESSHTTRIQDVPEPNRLDGPSSAAWPAPSAGLEHRMLRGAPDLKDDRNHERHGPAQSQPRAASVEDVSSAPSAAAGTRAYSAAFDKLALLQRLGELRQQGVLTEDEFVTQKAQVLGA